MKIRLLLWALLPALGLACSSGSGDGGTTTTTGGTGGNPDGGDGGFLFLALDPNATGNGDIAMAIGADDRVGVAYFTVVGQSNTGFDYAINYVEYKNGVVSAPSTVRVVQRPLGLTLAYQQDGTPAIGYLGGANYTCTGDAGWCTPTGSTYWLESQAAIAYLEPDGGWEESICMVDSTAMGAFNVSLTCVASNLMNRGSVVGLWPSLVFDGGTAIMVFRDVHDGQYPVQDWQASAAKMCLGSPSAGWSWDAPIASDVCECSNNHGAFGGHNQMIYGPNGSLAVISDQMQNDQGEVFIGGHDARFAMTDGDGGWTNSINPFLSGCSSTANIIHDTQTGPVMAWSSGTGYVVAAVDHSVDDLMYVASPDGVSWGNVEHVYNQGSGGWYPSIAIDPMSHEAAVAFFVCSLSPGASIGACSPTDAQLVVSERTPVGWQQVINIPGTNFYLPKLGYLSTGKAVIAYVQYANTGSSPVMLTVQP
jgi:hypothetical protein